MPHALVVEDDPNSLSALAEVVELEGFTTASAGTLASARAHFDEQVPDLVLIDLMLPDGSGIDLLKDPPGGVTTEVVVITGHASVDTAVQALRTGATDYLTKPVDIARLRTILTNVKRTRELKDEIGMLRDELRSLGRFGPMIGASAPMGKVYDLISRVAPTDATVLIAGESGTGKELAAQTVHQLSRRRKAPFLPINCGAVSPNLIESELFGHERGSFTGAERTHKGHFERASGGTIFLDEITEMPMELQVKLLRVLETGTLMRVGGTQTIASEVRVICATNREPEKAVTDGKLREDLYHRLNVFPIRLPPLRERGTDIEQLAQFFLDELNRIEGTSKTFSRDALVRLYQHSWPGNVRELKNYVQRAYIMADDVIECDVAVSDPMPKAEAGTTIMIHVGTPLEEVERRVTLATLAYCGHVKRK